MSPQLELNSKGSSDDRVPKSIQKELAILQLIHRRTDVSRVELVRLSGCSAGSMTAVIHKLIEKGLVVESGRRSHGPGRQALSLAVRRDAGYIVGVDLGSYYLRVVVTDLAGSLVYKHQMETCLSEGRQQVVKKTFNAIHKAIRECGIPKTEIRGIGMGHSGIIDSAAGVVVSFPRPGQMTEWKNVPLRQMLEEEFGVPSVLEDSVRAIASAEQGFGFGRNLEDFVYIDVGMGIGAGIILNGKLYKGRGAVRGNLAI